MKGNKKLSTKKKVFYTSKIRAQTTETCEDCQLKKLISAFCLYRESIYNTWYQAEFSSVFYVFVFFDIPMQKKYYIIEQQFQNQNLSFGNQGEGFFCLKRYTHLISLLCISEHAYVTRVRFDGVRSTNHEITIKLPFYLCFVVTFDQMMAQNLDQA